MVRTYIKSNGGLVEPHANGNVSNPSVVCFSSIVDRVDKRDLAHRVGRMWFCGFAGLEVRRCGGGVLVLWHGVWCVVWYVV
jgi:hypothetical protein